MMAAALVITVPSLVLFFIAQRQIVDSVAQSGIKG
jgi:ABC-type glycerol-3-phosphate transport system permease component